MADTAARARGERGPTGLAFSSSFLGHDTGPGHPENAGRLTAIVEHLGVAHLLDRLWQWEPQPVDGETLGLVHSPEHVAAIHRLVERGGGSIDADTKASPGSLAAALRAAGACVEAVDLVWRGTLRNAYCLVRPPGHHATPTQAMGFCLFNNVAVGAAWLLRHTDAQRIAILDFDVHHGNGTQDAFYERDDVLYVSTHQYPFYPGTGNWRDVGQNAGAGYTVNVPLPAGSGDAVYAAVERRIVEPVVRRYRPDVILVSLGFDAFWDDPLAMQRLSLNGYATLMRSALDLADELCGGRLMVLLEGGYNRDALAFGSEAVCRVLLGEDVRDDPLGPAPSALPVQDAEPLIAAVERLHGL